MSLHDIVQAYEVGLITRAEARRHLVLFGFEIVPEEGDAGGDAK